MSNIFRPSKNLVALLFAAAAVAFGTAWLSQVVAPGRAAAQVEARLSDKPTVEPERVAVIVHGFRSPLEPPQPPEWTGRLRDRLLEDGYDDALVFDWAAESNDGTSGWAEAAGARLFALLAVETNTRKRPVQWHLIGYSRGSVVVSEAQRRLSWYSRSVSAFGSRIADVRITFLDPHPANGSAGASGGNRFARGQFRAFEAAATDPAPQVWGGASGAELFFQQDRTPGPEGELVNPLGLGPESALAAHVGLLVDVTGTARHADFGDWYAGGMGADSALVRTTNPAPKFTPPPRPECVYNSDFRESGKCETLFFSAFAEQDRIPGWEAASHCCRVTSGGLLLRSSRAAAPAELVHAPLYIAPETGPIEIDVAAATGDGELIAEWVPVRSRAGSLEPLPASETLRLGSWSLRALASGSKSVSVFLSHVPECGATGCLRLRLTASGVETASLLLRRVGTSPQDDSPFTAAVTP